MLREERPIIRSDGTFTRDYIYVKDVVNAYIGLALALERADVQGQAFNFGMDRPTTALEMVQTIVNISEHPKLEPIILDQAPNEIPDQYLSSSKAHDVLNWYPSHDLENGLLKALNWYDEYLTTRN